jgi:FtsP/CotA-like multicopper oxidase with cupredoxin domain
MSERTPFGLTTGQPPRRATTGILQVVDLEAAEHDWEISPGTVAHGYAFNGQAPGPVIEARVGDTLLVRFTNLLPEPTTIRWHGLPEPAAMNGSELAADPVPPGGRLQYQLHLPHAGTFWYHSPIAATTQSNRGLRGALVVRDPEEPAFDGERVLLFDDLQLNRRGQLAAPDQLLRYERGPQGEVLLVNGVLEPKMQLVAGQVERWRLVNTTSARHLRLSLGGHRCHLIRTDGSTLHAVDEVLMNPGDRFDLAVGPLPSGETVVLEALPYDRRAGESPHRTLATLYVAPPDNPSRAPGVNLGVMAPPRANGVAGGRADLDFSGRGMDTLESRTLDREEG